MPARWRGQEVLGGAKGKKAQINSIRKGERNWGESWDRQRRGGKKGPANLKRREK